MEDLTLKELSARFYDRVGLMPKSEQAALSFLSKVFGEAMARAERAEAEAARLRDELETITSAADMPNDWPYGLPSWIRQRLYAAYIGDHFSDDVLEQIRSGRLTFPEAPIYAKAAALSAELAAAKAAINPWNTAPVGEHVTVTLTTVGWFTEDGVWDWDDLGCWDVLGWQPLPAATNGNAEQDDLFGDAEYQQRQEAAQAALATAQGHMS